LFFKVKSHWESHQWHAKLLLTHARPVLSFSHFRRLLMQMKRTAQTKSASKDLILIVVGAFCLVLTLGGTKFHVIETLVAFYQKSQYPWEFEELIVISLFFVWAFAFFALRRWRELRIEVKERSRLESELTESQRTLATLMSNVPGMAYRCRNDIERTMEFVGDFSSELTGVSARNLIHSREVSYGRMIHPEDAMNGWQQIQDSIKRHKPFQLTYRIRTSDGQEKWVWEQGIAIYSPSGEVVALEGIVLDITERRRMRELERIQQEQLAQADKMITLGTLVSGVAHEINNPTNFISLNAPILRETWRGAIPVLDEHYGKEGDFSLGRYRYSVMREKVNLLLDGIDEGAERIKNIVADLKDFARPDPSDMTQSIDLNKVILSACSLLKNPIQKRTKRFSMELSRDLPPIAGSFQKLEQVMINLIQNALEALPDNQKPVHVSSQFDPSANGILVRIRDEGCGISEESLPRIQDPFFTTKRAQGGVGLGLSITATIVRNHGGNLSFESIPGGGTIVSVTLPVKRTEPGTAS
jgi:PAS domain S-box-containing protein